MEIGSGIGHGDSGIEPMSIFNQLLTKGQPISIFQFLGVHKDLYSLHSKIIHYAKYDLYWWVFITTRNENAGKESYYRH